MSFDFQGFQSVLDQQRQVEKQKQAYREQAKATAKELVALFGFTADELGIAAEGAAVPAEKVKRIVKPKYRTPDGFEWTGRGRQPKKIAEAIAAGHSLESMAIH